MATKSVIEIELIDEQFKAFSAQLKAMQSIVAGMPEQWKAITKEVNEEQKAESKAANEAEKARKKRLQEEKDFNKIIEDRKKAFMDAAYFTSNIAKNLASGALSIAKWTAFAAIGGGFGLGGLAASASDYRKRSQGLGTTTAGLRAAETNLSQYVDVNSVLGNITNLQHDITQQYKLTRLGGGKGDSAAQLQTVMTKAVQDFKAHGQDLNYARAVGLTDIFSPEDLIRLAKLSAEELAGTFKKMSQDLKRFEIDDKVSRKWQEFWQQLGRAGQDIQVILIDKLQSLVKPLTELSAVIVDVIANFLKNNDVAKWIQGFGQSIKEFADYLGKPEFKQDIDDFVTNIGAMAEAIASILRKIGIVPEKSYRVSQADIAVAQQANPTFTPEKAGDWAKYVNTRRREAIDRFTSSGNLPLPVAIGLAANIEAESSWNPTAENKGHYGLGQWDTSRQKDFEKFAGHNIRSSSTEEQLDFFIYEMKNKEKKTWDEISKAYSKNGNYQDYTRIIGQEYERFGDNPNEFRRRSDIANRIASDAHVTVTINNTTDTNVAVKGLTNK